MSVFVKRWGAEEALDVGATQFTTELSESVGQSRLTRMSGLDE